MHLSDYVTSRHRLVINGNVLGVGFRAYVRKIAIKRPLVGFVQNKESEVVVEVEGTFTDIEAFIANLFSSLPRHMHIAKAIRTEQIPQSDTEFVVLR